MRKSLVVLLPLLSAVTLIGACSSKKPVVLNVSGGLGSTDGGSDAGDAGDGGDAGFAFLATSDAGPVATGPTFFTGDAGSSGTSTQPPALTEQALDTAIDLAITTASTKIAPKMDKDGAASRATLKEGEHFSMMVSMMPGRCYTFVAFSPPGAVTQLDMKLYAPPYTIEAGKSAAADKAMPVIGKGTAAMCPILPIAIPYKLDVGATKGAGRVGIQVYARNK